MAAILFNHAVADKAIAHTGHHRCFLDFFAQSHHGCKHVFAGFFTAHDFQQLHNVSGAEKVRANHVLRAFGKRSNLVHVQRRGVGRQNCAWLHHAVQLGKNFFFHAHLFKHGFDHHVSVFQVVVTQGSGQHGHTGFVFILLELAFFNLRFVVFTNGGDAAVERILLHFQHFDGNTSVQKIHGDTAAHGSCTNNSDGIDGALWRICRHIGYF